MANDVLPGAKLVQLKEWGYPQGSPRPTPPDSKAFSVIHITGNSRLPSAENEVAWRLNDPGNQNSATFFVNRDGSIVQALGDPLHMDPWANGDVNRPDTSNRRIAAVVADGVNANELTIVAIENVGYEPGNPINARQEDACARIIAHYHAKAGVAINRTSVIGHYQLNSVSRPNCPGVNKSVIDRIVEKARALGSTAEEPVTDGTWADKIKAELAECESNLAAKQKRIRYLIGVRDSLQAQIDAAEAELADTTDLQRTINRLRARVKAMKELAAQIQET